MKKLNFTCYIILLALLSGCVSFQPFPRTVRAGDTITLAIGTVDGANRSNVTVEYYSDSDPLNPIDLTPGLRSVLKLFPDKTSKAYWSEAGEFGTDNMDYLTTVSGHGPWQSVVVVDLPLSAPTGTGHVQVTLGSGVVYPATLRKVDDVTIAMEVLENVGGGTHDFEYHQTAFNDNSTIGDLAQLEQSRLAVVRILPNLFASYTPVSAAEYELTVPILDASLNDVTNTVANTDLVVVLDDQPNYIKNQTNLIWSRSGATIKVSVISVNGEQNPANIRFSILISNQELELANGWKIADAVMLDSVTYYDTNGDVMSGPTPEFIVQ